MVAVPAIEGTVSADSHGSSVVRDALSDGIAPEQKPGLDSVEGYFDRLKSFQIETWGYKPIALSPLSCAKLGWRCIKKDMLECVSCKQYMSAMLPPIYDPIYKNVCKKTSAKLLECHENTCPWRSYSTPAEMYGPNVRDRSATLQRFSTQLDSFCNLTDLALMLDELQLAELAAFDVTAEMLGRLFALLRENELPSTATVSRLSELPPTSLNKLLCLALTGWTHEGCLTVECARCDFCLRNIGFWHFKSSVSTSAAPDEENGASGSPPQKRSKRLSEVMAKELYPLAQHEAWCPLLADQEVPSVLRLMDAKLPENLPRWKLQLVVALRGGLEGRDSRAEIASTEVSSSGQASRDAYLYARQLLNTSVDSQQNISLDSSSSSGDLSASTSSPDKPRQASVQKDAVSGAAIGETNTEQQAQAVSPIVPFAAAVELPAVVGGMSVHPLTDDDGAVSTVELDFEPVYAGGFAEVTNSTASEDRLERQSNDERPKHQPLNSWSVSSTTEMTEPQPSAERTTGAGPDSGTGPEGAAQSCSPKSSSDFVGDVMFENPRGSPNSPGFACFPEHSDGSNSPGFAAFMPETTQGSNSPGFAYIPERSEGSNSPGFAYIPETSQGQSSPGFAVSYNEEEEPSVGISSPGFATYSEEGPSAGSPGFQYSAEQEQEPEVLDLVDSSSESESEEGSEEDVDVVDDEQEEEQEANEPEPDIYDDL